MLMQILFLKGHISQTYRQKPANAVRRLGEKVSQKFKVCERILLCIGDNISGKTPIHKEQTVVTVEADATVCSGFLCENNILTWLISGIIWCHVNIVSFNSRPPIMSWHQYPLASLWLSLLYGLGHSSRVCGLVNAFAFYCISWWKQFCNSFSPMHGVPLRQHSHSRSAEDVQRGFLMLKLGDVLCSEA